MRIPSTLLLRPKLGFFFDWLIVKNFFEFISTSILIFSDNIDRHSVRRSGAFRTAIGERFKFCIEKSKTSKRQNFRTAHATQQLKAMPEGLGSKSFCFDVTRSILGKRITAIETSSNQTLLQRKFRSIFSSMRPLVWKLFDRITNATLVTAVSFHQRF